MLYYTLFMPWAISFFTFEVRFQKLYTEQSRQKKKKNKTGQWATFGLQRVNLPMPAHPCLLHVQLSAVAKRAAGVRGAAATSCYPPPGCPPCLISSCPHFASSLSPQQQLQRQLPRPPHPHCFAGGWEALQVSRSCSERTFLAGSRSRFMLL